jgi:hypothetical protein
MASLYIGLNRGAYGIQVDEVTVGTSTGSTDVELRMDETKGLTRKDIHNIMTVLKAWLNDGRLDTYFH